jgi:DNA polymerase-3 subunit epsilon
MSRLLVRVRSWLTFGDGRPLAWAFRRFVALDLETTGLDPRRDAIVSVAAIPFVDGSPAAGYVTLVDPGRPIPPDSTAIHGITDGMVRGAPAVPQALRAAERALDGGLIVGHHVDFDMAMLARARRAHGLPALRTGVVDTARLAAALHPHWRDVSLERLTERLGIELIGRHTAEGDALTAGRIFVALLSELPSRGVGTVRELLWFQRLGRRH